MKITRINCFGATCQKCANHVLVKINGWGDFVYVCSFQEGKHDGTEAEHCQSFRCDEMGSTAECINCTGGEDVETYIKRRNI